MAKGEKTGGRNFEQGTSGNPKGRPRLPDDIKSMRKFNQAEFDRQANEFLFMPVNQLSEILENPAETALRKILAGIIVESAKNGDYKRLEFLLDRLIGKPTKHVETDISEESMHSRIVNSLNGIERKNQ